MHFSRSKEKVIPSMDLPATHSHRNKLKAI
jgi:hypothetical protein